MFAVVYNSGRKGGREEGKRRLPKFMKLLNKFWVLHAVDYTVTLF